MIGQLRRAVDRALLRDREYSFLFRRPEPAEAISLDCETTGLDPRVDEIVSIAAVPIRGSRILTSQAYGALVRPRRAVGATSIRVHQLREKDLAGARPMDEVLPEFLHFIGGRTLIGYYIGFDVRMLNKYLVEMLNIRLPNRRIDISRLYYDRKYANAPPGTRIDLRFATMRRDLGVPDLHEHDAFDDALSSAEMYLILRDMAERGARIVRDPSERPAIGFSTG